MNIFPNFCIQQSNAEWLSLSLILRPTVSRPVCLWIKHASVAYDQIFITVRQLRVCWCGALSLMRGRGYRSQLLLALARTIILESESRGTRDLFYCLIFETLLFFASYDSQGYGGGSRPRLHTGVEWLNSDELNWTELSIYNLEANRI
jgi:hypothetical protein